MTLGIKINPIFQEEQLASLPAISIELIKKFDSDIFFILSDDGEPRYFLLNNPLIASLQAAQNQQLHVVDREIWLASGPLVINKFLDDLPQYLLKAATDFELKQ
ncbi:MAG: hypothetical protein HC790_11340 [Acaryochloridaceae cyanobacterium CSU_3_4]|nr:hypothetical protein [Acaryochloridaceae cyanobacterium CSU_3_4]